MRDGGSSWSDSNIWDEPCGYCGRPYREHNDDTDCVAHQWARKMLARTMNKIYGFPNEEAE